MPRQSVVRLAIRFAPQRADVNFASHPDSPLVDPTMKFLSAALIAVSAALAAPEVQAQTDGCNCQSCSSCNSQGGHAGHVRSGYCENNMWPAQYVPTARCSVNSAYTAMINNGWRRQNLLGSHHFEEGSEQLSNAGKLKTKWILTQAPQDRRTVYIERGTNETETASRIAAVHSWANHQSPVIDPMSVTDTHIVSEGHTAGSVDHIFVGFQASQPAPVLMPSNGDPAGSNAQ